MTQTERLLLEKISKTNRLRGLFRPGSRIVLAVSGGPDSAAMAGLFSTLRKKHRLKLWAAHLNHGLSPQAKRFEAAARKAAGHCEIPFYRHGENVARLARRRKISIEEAGRIARYDFLVRLARRLRADAVATAHTRDDQVETVLFRIFRGTSLRGLAGIPYAREERGARLIRPLLDCGKEELTAYARLKKTPFVRDRSNRSPRHRRNRIRHELLPLLEKRFNPRVREAVARLAQASLEFSPLLARAADRAWASCRARRDKETLSLDRAAFSRLDRALQQELVLRAAEVLGAGRGALGRVHAEAPGFSAARAGSTLGHLPGLCVAAGPRRIVFRRV